MVYSQELKRAQTLAEPVWNYVPNRKMFAHHNSLKLRKFVFAANKSGKTFSTIHEDIYHATGIYPFWWQGIRKSCPSGRSAVIWIISPDFPSSRDIVQKVLHTLLPRWLVIYGEYSPQRGYANQIVRVKHFNSEGSRDGETIIQFKSSESGRKAFQGDLVDVLHFDEEFPEEVWDECLMRQATMPDGLVIGSMTPIQALLEGVTWMHQRIYNAADDDFLITTMGLIDNPVVTEEMVENKRKEIKDEDEAAVRIDGIFILGAGRPVFHTKNLQVMLKNTSKPRTGTLIKTGTKVEFCPEDGGWFEYWELPVDGSSYCLGADCSEGLPKGDKSSLDVLKRGSVLEQVAHVNCLCDPDEWGRRCVLVGEFYGFAPVGIESNSIGIAACISARDADYPNLYRREIYDTIEKKVTKKIGWQTTNTTRPQMVASGQAYVRDMKIKINNRKTIEEMLTFIRNKKGKPEAMDRCHDDRVMSLLIAIQMHELNDIEDCEVLYEKEPEYNSEVLLQQSDWDRLIGVEDFV